MILASILFAASLAQAYPDVNVMNQIKSTMVKVKFPTSHGTGIVVSSSKEGSYILTNYHVCDLGFQARAQYTPASIRKINGNPEKLAYYGQVVEVSEGMDLCLIFTSKVFQDVVKLADEPPVPQEWVGIYGNPGDQEGFFSQGYVISPIKFLDDMFLIRTSAPVQGGMSGSGMFNERGEVIGLTNIQNRSESYGVPLLHIKNFLKRCGL